MTELPEAEGPEDISFYNLLAVEEIGQALLLYSKSGSAFGRGQIALAVSRAEWRFREGTLRGWAEHQVRVKKLLEQEPKLEKLGELVRRWAYGTIDAGVFFKEADPLLKELFLPKIKTLD